MTEENDKKIKELQLIEQNAQQYLMQKQQFQTQLIEIKSALGEIKETDETYKIIGNIMVKTSREKLKKDLKEKMEIFNLRIKTLEKQEKKLKEKAKEIQTDILSGMKDDK